MLLHPVGWRAQRWLTRFISPPESTPSAIWHRHLANVPAADPRASLSVSETASTTMLTASTTMLTATCSPMGMAMHMHILWIARLLRQLAKCKPCLVSTPSHARPCYVHVQVHPYGRVKKSITLSICSPVALLEHRPSHRCVYILIISFTNMQWSVQQPYVYPLQA